VADGNTGVSGEASSGRSSVSHAAIDADSGTCVASFGLELLALAPVDLLGDHDVRIVAQVDVFPGQSQQLADPDSRLRQQREEGAPTHRHRGQDRHNVLGGQRARGRLAVLALCGIRGHVSDACGRVGAKIAVFDGRGEHDRQCGLRATDRAWCRATTLKLAEPVPNVGRYQFAHPDVGERQREYVQPEADLILPPRGLLKPSARATSVGREPCLVVRGHGQRRLRSTTALARSEIRLELARKLERGEHLLVFVPALLPADHVRAFAASVALAPASVPAVDAGDARLL
jgi:hypothetical protein